jgi:hypothetical protein
MQNLIREIAALLQYEKENFGETNGDQWQMSVKSIGQFPPSSLSENL